MRRHLVVQCMECGHLHWTHEGYIPCPIQDCPCTYAEGDTYATELHTFDRIARLLEQGPNRKPN